MQTLSLAMRNSEDEGLALPSVFPSLEKHGAKFRRSQLSLVAAAPGGGKSAFATYVATRMEYWDDEQMQSVAVPSLYWSADSDKKTLGNRVTASVTKHTVDEAEKLLDQGDEETWRMLEANTNHIWFAWDRGPSLDDIEAEVEAFALVHGEWPHVIFIDNLKNVWVEESGDGGEHIRYDRVLDYLHELAGITGAHIMVLHHVTGVYENGDQPIPLGGILGKVTKPFRLILTIHRTWDGQMGICIVKNSNGPMAANGSLIVKIPVDLERMQYMDNPNAQLHNMNGEML
jgi:streptogramin lyase